MIILGIDPGYGRLGYAVLRSEGGTIVLVEAGCIETSKDDTHAARLSEIASRVRALFEEYHPERLVIDGFFLQKIKQRVWRLQKRAALCSRLPVPLDAMCASGSHASKTCCNGLRPRGKSQVQEMVKHLLHLDDIPKPDDAADACAIAICGAQKLA